MVITPAVTRQLDIAGKVIIKLISKEGMVMVFTH